MRDVFGAANLFADLIRYLLCADLVFVCADLVRDLLGVAFFNPRASLVRHFLGAALFDPIASLVRYFTRAGLIHIAANRIRHSLGTTFADHSADFVRNLLRCAARNLAANRVRHSLCAALWNPLCARNFFRDLAWAPNFATDRAAGALHANVFRAARVARIGYALVDNGTRNVLGNGFPISAIRLDAFVGRYRLHHCVTDIAIARLPLSLPSPASYRLVTGLVDRLLDGVAYFAIAGLVNRLLDCIAFRLVASLVNRPADCIANITIASLVNWSLHLVANVAITSSVNRLADIVGDALVFCFPNVLDAANWNAFANGVVDRLVAGVFLSIPANVFDSLVSCRAARLGRAIVA